MLTKWDDIFKLKVNEEIVTDDFLDRNIDYIKNIDTKILDLGCGNGNISKRLKELGKKVIAVDSSNIALDIVKEKLKVEVLNIDMRNKLPFKNEKFELVIADLSLHYFSEEDTFKILREIKRILKKSGVLMFRVNSIKDINYGANSNNYISHHYYNVMDMKKRFFDIKDIFYYFQEYKIISIKENQMLRYEKPKNVIEGIVKKELV